MSDLTSYLSKVNRPLVKFHPQRTSNCQRETLVHKGKISDLFVRSGVSITYCWVNFDVSQDLALCHVCMTAEFEKYLASTKRDPAFITTGYTYWKEAVTAFKRHANSTCHREAIEASCASSYRILVSSWMLPHRAKKL